jgi:hypothetical protein
VAGDLKLIGMLIGAMPDCRHNLARLLMPFVIAVKPSGIEVVGMVSPQPDFFGFLRDQNFK